MRRVGWSRRLAPAAFVGLLAAPAGPAAAAQAPGYTDVVPITFPADPRVAFEDDYHEARGHGTRVHRATDLFGDKLWKVHAAVDGEICYQSGAAEPVPEWGYQLTLCGADGRVYRYVHLNNDNPGTDDGAGGPEWAYAPGVRPGVQVRRGQWLGHLGDSGNAEGTPAHLHFEIRDDRVVDPYGSNRVDPYFSLVAARDRGDVPTEPGPQRLDPVERFFGPDRVGTAVTLSQTFYEHAPRAVVAPAASHAETVAAGPLAAQLGAPVLITWPDRLDPRVRGELERLRAVQVTIVGDRSVVSDAVAAELAAGALRVERVAGEDAFGTAAAVAERVWGEPLPGVGGEPLPGTGPRRAVVALGSHPDPGRAWPDALMAGYYGAAEVTPVLLVAHDHLPAVTAAALEGVDDAVLLGGPAAVSEASAAEVDRHAGSVRRLAGPDRYATATAVTDELLARRRVLLERVWAATAHDWADAVTAGVVVAGAAESFVLVDGGDRGGDAGAGRWLYARGLQIDAARVLGGDAAVSPAAAARLGRRIS